MDKKIEKLVELTAKEIGQHTENCSWDICSASEKDAARRSAIFILSHPDLALIVKRGGAIFSNAKGKYQTKAVVIPLAEALKEAKK